MRKIISIIYRALARLFKVKLFYISKCKGSNKWVFISYIPEVFYKLGNENYMRGHQSRREMVEMVTVFNKLGYNVYVSSCNNPKLPSKDFDIVFGVEPGFVYACNKYPRAKKIYYATGSHWNHQNSMIKKRTDEFNKTHHTSLPYTRLVKVYNQLEMCDLILQIGSRFTIDTYPEEYKEKISIIHQSNSLGDISDLQIGYAEENEYIWIGGGGAVLKGLDLVLDYFILHTDKKLHVVGNVEDDFKKIYHERLNENIILHGHMNLASEGFRSIANRCNYIIYPSCTEAGCPGAVINAMYFGLIPIVSKWAAPDDIEELGYILNDLSVDAITAAVEESSKVDHDLVIDKKLECSKYIKQTFNLRRFSSEFEKYMHNVIEN